MTPPTSFATSGPTADLTDIDLWLNAREEGVRREGGHGHPPPSQCWWAASYPLLQQLLTLISSLLQIWEKRLTLVQSLLTTFWVQSESSGKALVMGLSGRNLAAQKWSRLEGVEGASRKWPHNQGPFCFPLPALVWLLLRSAEALGFHHEHSLRRHAAGCKSWRHMAQIHEAKSLALWPNYMDSHKEQSNRDSAIVLFFTIGKGFGNQVYFAPPPPNMSILHDMEAFPSLQAIVNDGRRGSLWVEGRCFLKGSCWDSRKWAGLVKGLVLVLALMCYKTLGKSHFHSETQWSRLSL